MTLIERVEQAGPEQQRKLLDQAWDGIAKSRGLGWAQSNARSFGLMIDAEAYLSAAEMLVPEGWNWMAGSRNQPIARAYINNGELSFVGLGGMKRNPKQEWYEHTASTPALALLAAILKSKEVVHDKSR